MTRLEQCRAVESFEVYPDQAYVDADLTGLAAYAIKRLIDLHLPTTFENIVVALFRMFPDKFSLVGFDNYPDAARVGRTLLQLGPKYRNWARGSVQKGFVLTESGNVKVEAVSRALTSGRAPIERRKQNRSSTPRTKDVTKDIRAIESSSLFRHWRAGTVTGAKPIELFDLLGAYAYTPKKVLRARISDLKNIAQESRRSDIFEFLQTVSEVFDTQLRD